MTGNLSARIGAFLVLSGVATLFYFGIAFFLGFTGTLAWVGYGLIITGLALTGLSAPDPGGRNGGGEEDDDEVDDDVQEFVDKMNEEMRK